MLDVSCAILIRSSKIMIVRRSPEMRLGGKWEFPGGKVDAGESPEECIIREIKEELLIDVRILKTLQPVFHSYPRGDIRLLPFVVELISSQDPQLTEHDEIAWVNLDEITTYDLAPADIPILKQLAEIELK
jgi:8-oxo-dGTP diphosphatase